MKRTLLVCLLALMTLVLFGRPTMQANLGIDFPGTHSFDDNDEDSNMGISPSFEVLFPINSVPNLLVGAGLEYQLPRGLDIDNYDGKFGFIPVYVTGKYCFSKNMPVYPEAILNLGYGILTGNDDYKNDADLNGGLAWGIGAGVVHPMGVSATLMYRSFNGGFDSDLADFDVTQSNLTFSLGYRF